MSDATVYLFADTNLLIQCRPLEQLGWDMWCAFEEVRIIVSAPVLREIDNQKNRGNDRLGRRARKASAMFREILADGQKIVRKHGPRVILSVELHHQQSKELEDRLNYQERDDQLIGTVHAFASQDGDRDVRLLTHDTTPLFTAKSLGLAAEMIPDDWLLPPENTEAEKELAALRSENVRLRKTEPAFAVRCLGPGDENIECYEITHTVYEPLTDSEVEELLARVKKRFPIETDFGSTEPAERPARAGLMAIAGMKEEFVPTSEDEIAKYREDSYPQWLDDCEKALRGLHHTLQAAEAPLTFIFLAENTGTRPATDALVTIEARGNFLIWQPARRDDDDDEDGDDEEGQAEDKVRLPRPPAPPQGQWRTVSALSSFTSGSAFDMFGRSGLAGLGLHDPLRGTYGPSVDLLHRQLHPTPRDANAFYYKPKRPMTPLESYSLECDQWRHDDGEEPFFGEIFLHPDQDGAQGAISCRIQAGNLSDAVSMTVPVRIAVSRISAVGRARELVDKLTAAPEFRIGPRSGQAGASE